MARKKRRNKDVREVPVERFLPEDVHVEFSDSVIVQHTENEFILTFLQTEHPLAITNDEFRAIKKVRTIAVARIMVTPKHMASIVDVCQRNFKKYTDKHGEIAPGETLEQSEELASGEAIKADTTADPKQIELDIPEETEAK